jgi:hypothetical protein
VRVGPIQRNILCCDTLSGAGRYFFKALPNMVSHTKE